ncbi:hypothetical protein JTE90_003719 [Oedothorax gibbosus]|uniref:t-SNARE coiled-coil homology domain-containing protein n=1 Tax=Oedothorax gibbosus TaxID=931172 RepID=A0AAV6VAL3_9ARAC|nr:hypothetical protein JTE90_003719 [Oedothorax gibbosus]
MEKEDPPKWPFRRLKFALDQVVCVAIPLHIRLLNEQSERLEQLQHRPLELRGEQLKAANTVKLLKQDLFELDNLHRQVLDVDQEVFHRSVEGPLREAVEVLSCFMSVHSDVLGPLMDTDHLPVDLPNIPEVVCDTSAPSQEEGGEPPQLQVAQLLEDKAGATADAWSFLRRELLELHGLMRHFSMMVFRQQESVDSIQANVVEARENVHAGAGHLRKAALLQATSLPLAGALIGGVLLGPVGALVGLKLAGCVGCAAGGGVLGYTAGARLKKRQQHAIEGIPLKALSSPDLTSDKQS